MSVEGVTDGAARVAGTAPDIVKVYATASSGQPDVFPIEADVGVLSLGKGIAIVRHEGFVMVHSGKPEQIRHAIVIEIWVSAASPGAAEKSLLPLVTQIITAFRTKVGLYGQGAVAKVNTGGPPADVDANGKPYIVYPVVIMVTELTVNDYQLGPGS
jgi:hypothetical protein